MTCQDFELLLAGDDLNEDAQAHLEGCAKCRELAAELSANASALRGLRDEPLALRNRRAWRWAVPIAAVLALVAVLFPWKEVRNYEAPQQAQLKIKMLTSDPDVVVYWIIDSNGGE